MSLKDDDIHFPSGRILLYRSRCESEELQMFKKEPEWSSRCPSFLAGESVKDGQKHCNIKQHMPTNRPNKKRPWKSIKEMRTCGFDSLYPDHLIPCSRSWIWFELKQFCESTEAEAAAQADEREMLCQTEPY